MKILRLAHAVASATSSSALVSVMLLMIVSASTTVQADILDSGPMAWESSYAWILGPSTAGGTVTTNENRLAIFSLWLGVEGGTQANSLRAIVLATDASGAPVGAPLWESGDFEAVGARKEYAFWPNIVVDIGEKYFVGVDSGLLTNVSGGDFTLQAAGDPLDELGGGMFWQDEYGAGFASLSGGDIRTTITTATNPEPTTGTMLGLGLALLSWARKKPRFGAGPH
jgi:hypothetical protein